MNNERYVIVKDPITENVYLIEKKLLNLILLMNLLQKRREKERKILLRNIKTKSEKRRNFKMIVKVFDGIDSETPIEIILIGEDKER